MITIRLCTHSDLLTANVVRGIMRFNQCTTWLQRFCLFRAWVLMTQRYKPGQWQKDAEAIKREIAVEWEEGGEAFECLASRWHQHGCLCSLSKWHLPGLNHSACTNPGTLTPTYIRSRVRIRQITRSRMSRSAGNKHEKDPPDTTFSKQGHYFHITSTYKVFYC